MNNAEIRDRIVKRWLSLVGTPYFYGGESENGIDCSGLVRVSWSAEGVWPFGERDGTAAMLWASCPHIPWDDRQPGDVVCYGRGGLAFHCVGVIDANQLVGANSGEPFETRRAGETAGDYAKRRDEYVGRMAARGAKVKVTDADYWASARLGVIRAPALCEAK